MVREESALPLSRRKGVRPVSLASFEGGASLENGGVGMDVLGRPSSSINHARGSAFGLPRRETPPSHVLSSPPYNFRDARGYNPLIHPGVARVGLCEGDFLSHPSPFFKDVYCPQENVREEAYNRPLTLEPFAQEVNIQNGGSDEGCEMRLPGALGSKIRPERCVLQYLTGRPRYEVLRLRPGEAHFHLRSPPIRTCHSPLGIHKGYKAYQKVAKTPGYSDLVISGRFPNPSQFLQGGSRSHIYCDRSAAEARFGNKLGKVFPSPGEEIGIPGGHSRPRGNDFWASRSKDFEGFVSGDFSREPLPAEVRTGESHRVHKLCSKFSPFRQAFIKANTKVGEYPLVPTVTDPAGPCRRGAKRGFASMGKRDIPSFEGANKTSSTIHDLDDRCIRQGLGGYSAPTQDSRRVEPISGGKFHQLERVEGNSLFASTFPPIPPRKMFKPSGRQHVSPVLHQAPGNLGFRPLMGSFEGNSGVCSGTRNLVSPKTFEGSSQRPCGQGFSSLSNSHGMVFGQEDLSRALQRVGVPRDRHVCHQREHPVANIRVPMPRQIGLGGGCVYIRLERVGVTLLVSSTSAPGGNNPSLEGFQWGRVPDCTLLALAAMVPSSVREVPDQVPTSGGLPPITRDYPRDRTMVNLSDF